MLQVKIIVVSVALHNFIKQLAVKDVDFQPYDDDGYLLPTKSIGDVKH
jgi:hypothetical protein